MDDKFIPEGTIPDSTENNPLNTTVNLNTETDIVTPKAESNEADTIPDTNTDSITPKLPPEPTTQAEKKKAKKEHKNFSFGKLIFIMLICFALILSSVLVLTNPDVIKYMKNPDTDSETSATTNSKHILDDNVVAPTLEDIPSSDSEYSGSGPMTPEQIYTEIKDINVGVLVYSQSEMVSEGSGIVYAKNSQNTHTYIVTAAHVVDGKNLDFIIQFNDGTEVDAEIVGSDKKTDIAVLRIKGTSHKTATLGNSDKLAVGHSVYAIGNPGGIEFFGSFTSGMVSAIDRPVPTNNTYYDLPCIQHTAAINPGNSGGALVNEYGQVIGLNSSKISSTEYEGMGFAVPSKTVNEVYLEIVKNGYVTNRPKLGITYFPVSEDNTYFKIARNNNLPVGSIVINSISEDSSLYNTDVRKGDIITAVNGEDLDTTSILLETIEKSNVNDKITLTIYRINTNGTIKKSFNVTVKLVEDNS